MFCPIGLRAAGKRRSGTANCFFVSIASTYHAPFCEGWRSLLAGPPSLNDEATGKGEDPAGAEAAGTDG